MLMCALRLCCGGVAADVRSALADIVSRADSTKSAWGALKDDYQGSLRACDENKVCQIP